MQKERTTNTSKTKAGNHTELHQVAELNKEQGRKKTKTKQTKSEIAISEGAPQMDKISSLLSTMYAAFKLPSSSLEQEHTQRLKTSSSFLYYRFKRLTLEILKSVLKSEALRNVVFCPMKLLVPDFKQYIGGAVFPKAQTSPDTHTFLILVYFIYRSNERSDIQYASNLCFDRQDFCDTL